MPAFVAGGSRNQTYDLFRTAMTTGDTDTYPVLLVDSEDPVEAQDVSRDSTAAWTHLQQRDSWQRPPGARNDQAQLMATCMETWIMADRTTLLEFFGTSLNHNRLLPVNDLERRTRQEVQESLEMATVGCGANKMYTKRQRSFHVLAVLNPATLRDTLPNFNRFIETLHFLLG